MTTPAQRVSAYRIAGPAILLIAGVVATVLALIYGGGAEAPRLLDPGPVVRWGLPVVKMLSNVTGAIAPQHQKYHGAR